MKRLIAIVISLGLLAAIYSLIDLDAFIAVVLHCRGGLLLVGLAMVAPITVFTAWRFLLLVPRWANVGLGEALKLVLAASTLNMVLPSKIGDLSKAYFMRNKGHMTGPAALSVVLFEKLCDVLSLLSWCLVGLLVLQSADAVVRGLGVAAACLWVIGLSLLVSRRLAGLFFGLARLIPWAKAREFIGRTEQSWSVMQRQLAASPAAGLRVALASLALWLMHLLQIWLFILALNAQVGLVVSFSLTALAIFAGLLPFSFAGVGARDAALIYLYAGYFSPAVGAALGLLCTMRYVMPALAGLPFIAAYMRAAPGGSPSAGA
ncbi:conserved hypothetical protein [Desulfarculus baarsii DSM 2075]|uniref:Lysylphosphatidylglycerol synthetase/UPF0104 n=1 Tax=Desulfarculus baarsii (strain ATCC 33931 / DSM 2075 / LMG 7858 / VKM B-1802 / 2st14) TaxID=644282 RepID=E1QKP8_DESB2|nr:lysylphosphatidylglycerol synthase transmembrane domain-containing protein [Desulfarculus baarsii]ADK86257.1 conserved hypothetical protein [Desulfarculus baarsii DSM 2075]